jgi:hypothetical protein
MLLSSRRVGWRSAGRTRVVLPALCVSIALVAAGPLVAVAATGTPAHGTLTASGAVHGTWHQSSVNGQCVIYKGADAPRGFSVVAELYYGVGTSNTTGKPIAADPLLSIGVLKPSGSTHKVNLSKTKSFQLSLTAGPSNLEWISGWQSHTGNPPYHHLGSGTISMSNNGETGTVSTTMVYYVTHAANVHIKASWNCG